MKCTLNLGFAISLISISLFSQEIASALDVSITSYGAVSGGSGNASVNTTAFINSLAAVNTAGGGSVHVPAGTYYVDSTQKIRVLSNTCLYGDGPTSSIMTAVNLYAANPIPANDTTILTMGAGGTAVTQNVTLQNLGVKFDAVSATRGASSLVIASRIIDLTVQNCSFLNSNCVHLYLDRVDSFTVQNNTIGGGMADGIQLSNGSDSYSWGYPVGFGTISDNTITNTHDDAICIWGRYASNSPNRNVIQQVVVSNNTVNGTTTHGGGVNFAGAQNCEAFGNTISNTAEHFFIVSLLPSMSGNGGRVNKDIYIHDNTCVSTNGAGNPVGGPTGPRCVEFGARYTADDGSSETTSPCAENIVFENNSFTINDRNGIYSMLHPTLNKSTNWPTNIFFINNGFAFSNGQSTTLDFRGAFMDSVATVMLSGNSFSGFPNVGLMVTNQNGVRICSNTVQNCVASSTFSTNDMISIQAPPLTFNGNLGEFSGNQIIKTTGKARYGLNLGNVGTSYLYFDNVFNCLTGNVTAPSAIYQASTVVIPADLISIETAFYNGAIDRSSHEWDINLFASNSSLGCVQSLPDSGQTITTNYPTQSPELDYTVNFATPGTYYVWVRGAAGTGLGNSDSCVVGLDGAVAPASDDFFFSAQPTWIWDGLCGDQNNARSTITVTTAGAHTINLWMREDGTFVDKIILTQSSTYTPTGYGPAARQP